MKNGDSIFPGFVVDVFTWLVWKHAGSYDTLSFVFLMSALEIVTSLNCSRGVFGCRTFWTCNYCVFELKCNKLRFICAWNLQPHRWDALAFYSDSLFWESQEKSIFNSYSFNRAKSERYIVRLKILLFYEHQREA